MRGNNARLSPRLQPPNGDVAALGRVVAVYLLNYLSPTDERRVPVSSELATRSTTALVTVRCTGRSHGRRRDAHTGAATCWTPECPYVSVVVTLFCLLHEWSFGFPGHGSRFGAGLPWPFLFSGWEWVMMPSEKHGERHNTISVSFIFFRGWREKFPPFLIFHESSLADPCYKHVNNENCFVGAAQDA
jgi:hypothetical protein